MTIYNATFTDNAPSAPIGWNAITDIALTTTGSLLDSSDVDAGVNYEITSAYTGVTGAIAWADSDLFGFPTEVWRNCFYASSGIGAIDLKGLPAGYNYVLKIIGHTNNAPRDTDYTVEGVTLRYDNTATSAERVSPIEFTGVVPSDGIISVSQNIVEVFSYINGFILEVTPTGETITNIDGDNTVYLGQATNITMSGSADTAVSVTLGGKAQTIEAGATATNLPITISNDLPYGTHQLTVELP